MLPLTMLLLYTGKNYFQIVEVATFDQDLYQMYKLVQKQKPVKNRLYYIKFEKY